MEPEQVEKRLAWLDDQHLKEAESLKRLAERLEAMEKAQASQSRHTQDLSADVARLAALSTRIQQFDETVNKHRQEVAHLLEGAEERRSEKERVLERLRKTDQEEQAKALAQLRAEFGSLEEFRQAFESRREEELRIGRTLDAMAKRIDTLVANDEGRARDLLTLDHNQKHDSQRLNEIQSTASELRVKSEGLRGGMDTFEDRARRLETRVAELAAGENERREAQALWFDQIGLKMAEFEHSWKDWERHFDSFEKRAGDLDERLQAYEETHRGLKQLQADLGQVLERLERRITELTEMQRLTQERLRQEWATFQADDQKRWNTYKLSNDEQWREHTRRHDKLNQTQQSLEERVGEMAGRVAELGEAEKQHLMDLLAMLREWAADTETQAAEGKR